MFLDKTIVLGSEDFYAYIQSSEPDDMQVRFQAAIADIVAQNVIRVSQQLDPFNIYDVDISGGGDGFTFVVRFFLSTFTLQSPPVGWAASILSNIKSAFWMASTAEALDVTAAPAVASLVNFDLDKIAVGMAGASQGTRFMAFMAGQNANT